MYTLICIAAVVLVAPEARAQDCPVDIPDHLRRDCYPWHIEDDDAGRQKCEAMGCVWCETETPDTPFCFFDDLVCPSEIPEGQRVDCHPEPDASKEECLRRGCTWCLPEAGGPACFQDDSVNQGGDICPDGFESTERVDCHPEPGAGHEECLARGCYWCETDDDGPWCFVPKEHGYRIVGDPVETPEGYEVTLRRINYPSWFGLEIDDVLLQVEFQSDSRLRIKFTDINAERFEVPVAVDPPEDPGSPDNRLYDVIFESDPVFSFQVVRKSTGAVIFDTSIGGLKFSDQFIQIGTYLDSAKVIGFGEHEHHSFLHDMDWQTWGMWTRDLAVAPINLYGQQPFYMNIEQSNDAHGVLFFNANAQDVKLQPHPALLFRTIGGVLDMYLFLGPSPEEVTQQFTEAVGRPVMVPYWSLGFQLCRWGYRDLDHMKEVIGEMRDYDIPHDVQYGDIDYMYDKRDFTLDEVNFGGLPDYVDQLKAEGTRFVIILDPGISNQYDDEYGDYKTFDRGEAADVWIKEADGTTSAEGEVWPGLVYYPDFTNPATQDWWTTECIEFKDVLDYAGLWIDMNEPSNFIHGRVGDCPNERWNYPPYLPAIADGMVNKTLCMQTTQYGGEDFYNLHSLYGLTMSAMSLPAARAAVGDRSIVYSRSTFPGTGRYAQHWLGDNWSEWSNLRWSVIGILEFNLFGFPYVGADICGFIDVPSEEMCARWQQLGAFYTFSRNHNAEGNPDQHPPVWPSVAEVTRETLHIRYTLLPYLYTLFHYAHTTGGTVLRPLLNNFIQDETTHAIHDQFMWGDAFLINPVLDEGAVTVHSYFPQARWYSYYDGEEVSVSGDFFTLDAPIDFIPLHVRGGFILPTQRPANSTLFSRLLPMGLIVALDEDSAASGSLFWDDGESLDTHVSGDYFMASYQLSSQTLTSTITHDGYPGVASLMLDDVRIMGENTITSLSINDVPHEDWSQDSSTLEIVISNAGVALSSEFTVTWS